ncbi:DUF2975 domain-containing protein [Bifidobacterium sp.]|jgi:hypothetical protein|uniref:DUF2975 domain-containing protein n=1 Tax=Bifidobacterium sp. TaxID=41200 RepID=UPI0025C24ABD|nr:DUF2975 domain-containing protein [Bifidobacterium sp.]MCI1225215.1 DUF2975 domain-containing protein [Bifidobacterium sp.]
MQRNAKEHTDRMVSIGGPHVQPVLIGAIKVLIALLGLVALVCQVWALPWLAARFALEDPSHAYLRYPYLVVAIALFVCLEVVLAAMWQLLTMVARGVVFSTRAKRLVDIVIWAAVAAGVMVAGLCIYGVIASAGPPLFAVVLLISLTAILCFVLLMVVMRALLAVATAQRDELEAVI